MLRKIDNTTIENTDKCDINYECLDNTSHCCFIEKCIGNELMLITNLRRKCNYSAQYGDSLFCLCPVRKEIYKKYSE